MLKSPHQNFKNWIILMLIIQGNVNSAKGNSDKNSEDEYLVSKLGCVCLRWTDWVQIGTAYNLHDSPQTYGNMIKTGVIMAQTTKMDICIVPVSTDCRVLVPKLKPEINLNQDYTACPYVLNDMASDDGHVQIRFLCWDENCPCLQWSKWYNHDRPNDEGDLELLHHTITKHDWPCPQGASPLDVECRTAEGKLMSDSNDKSIECDLNGFRCLNDLQGDNCNCDDYKIRFLCVRPHQFPVSIQLEERDFQYNNCSVSNCPREKPIGRSRGPSSTLDTRAAFSEEIPTPIKRIYGYGPCQIPLTCPRINLIKLGRVFVSARQQTKERSKTRPKVMPKVDCKRNPNAKECNLRSRHERQLDVADSNRKRREIGKHDIYLPENISFVGPMERHWKFIPSTKPQSIKRIATTVPVIARSRKNSPKWKDSIHQALPPYDQYHYNYPLMMPNQQQEMNEYYFSRNRQLPEKDDDGGSEDRKKS